MTCFPNQNSILPGTGIWSVLTWIGCVLVEPRVSLPSLGVFGISVDGMPLQIPLRAPGSFSPLSVSPSGFCVGLANWKHGQEIRGQQERAVTWFIQLLSLPGHSTYAVASPEVTLSGFRYLLCFLVLSGLGLVTVPPGSPTSFWFPFPVNSLIMNSSHFPFRRCHLFPAGTRTDTNRKDGMWTPWTTLSQRPQFPGPTVVS